MGFKFMTIVVLQSVNVKGRKRERSKMTVSVFLQQLCNLADVSAECGGHTFSGRKWERRSRSPSTSALL